MAGGLGEENWYERNFPTFISVGHYLYEFISNIPSNAGMSLAKKPEIILTRERITGKTQPPSGLTSEEVERINSAINLFLNNWEKQEIKPIREAAKTSREMSEKLASLERTLNDLKGKFDAHSRVFESKTYEEAITAAKALIVDFYKQSAIEFKDTKEASDLAQRVFEKALMGPIFSKYQKMYDKRVDEHLDWDKKEHKGLERRVEQAETRFSEIVTELQATTEKSRKKERLTYISGVVATLAAAATMVFLTYHYTNKSKSEILASQKASEAKLDKVYSAANGAKEASEQAQRTIVGKITGLEATLTETLTEISGEYQQILADYKQIVSTVDDIKQIYQSQLEMSKADSQKIDASLGILDERFKKLGATLSQYENYAEQGRRETKGNLEELSRFVKSFSTSLQQVSKSQVSYDTKIEEVLLYLDSIQDYVSNFSYELEELKTPTSQPIQSQPQPISQPAPDFFKSSRLQLGYKLPKPSSESQSTEIQQTPTTFQLDYTPSSQPTETPSTLDLRYAP